MTKVDFVIDRTLKQLYTMGRFPCMAYGTLATDRKYLVLQYYVASIVYSQHVLGMVYLETEQIVKCAFSVLFGKCVIIRSWMKALECDLICSLKSIIILSCL